MSHQVTVSPSGLTFAVDDDESILTAALRHGLVMPYGCRDGACGSCKGKIVDGQVSYPKVQPQALSESERLNAQALFCCAHAESDLVIEARVAAATGMPVKTLPARVERLEKLAPDVALLELKLPASDRLQFLAGQYVDILLRDGHKRSFSLANPPHDDTRVQLHIRHVSGGRFTEQVFTTMKARDILRLNGPHGSFYLREESNKPMVLLAGGTGFAPIKSLVEHALHEGIQRPMHFYWGARRREGLYLHDLPRQWAADFTHFQYVPVLSEVAPEDAWQGRTGLAHQAVLADLPDLSGFQVYACGSPAMIDAARRDFVAAGLPADEFFSDAFTFATAA